MLQQINLFDIQIQRKSCEQLTAEAEASILRLFQAGHPVFVAFSGGKDSSVVMNMTLVMARKAKDLGMQPVVVVTSSDTLVENPEIAWHLRDEHTKIRAFGKKHGLRVVTRIVQPTLAQSFQLKVLSGRGMPSYAGSNSDCSTSLKIVPQISARNGMFRDLKKSGMAEPVTVLGTRFGESEKRDLAMKARGDRHDEATRNRDGDLVLSPIAMFDTDDVWEYIGLASSGVIDAYSDFEETKRIYAASVGTSCVVVADAIMEGGKKQRVGKCGARHGCWSCLQSEDKSLEAMASFDERYAYARGLLKLNRYLRNIRWDWSRRHWVGRTIKAGYIAIQPDTFHPKEIRALTRMMLQLDYDERQAAAREGRRVMFQILPLELMVGVDAIQSLNGLARPFACWADLRDIESGIRYDVPEVEPVAKTEIPAARFLKVGPEWDAECKNSTWTGLRNPYMEAMTERSGCYPSMTELENGRVVWEVETERSFSVDSESAALIEEFEQERLVEMHDRGYPVGSITAAYMWYLQYGVLTLSHGHQMEHDMFARRTAYKDRHGLTLEYSVDALLEQTISFAELPPEAARVWGGKATTESAQTSFVAVLDESVEGDVSVEIFETVEEEHAEA